MQKKIEIEGMSCNHCVNHVKEALLEIGATAVEVSLENKVALAEVTKDMEDEKIKLAVEDAGYDVIKIETII